MRKLVFLCSLVFILIMAGCANNQDSNVEFEKEDYEKLSEPNNYFAFELLHFAESDKDGNLMLSPTSALMAVLMAYNGADGDTKKEMQKSLQLEEYNDKQINSANAAVLGLLDYGDQIELAIANSLWIHEDHQFMDEYASTIKDYYRAEMGTFVPQKESSVKKINQWVADATNDKIKEMLDSPLHPDTRAVLINAIYFNGSWKYPFEKETTHPAPFYIGDREKTVSFMVLEEELSYMENESVQAVKLPYGDEEMNMEIYVPKEGTDIRELMEQTDKTKWKEWQQAFAKQMGTIKLPKFKLEYEEKLNTTLQKMGIDLAFKKDADFSNMIQNEEPLWIEEVKQKTFIDVNEEGTEAAASTSVEMRTTSAPVGTFTMDVNKPFLFAITDQKSGIILFIGVIQEPFYEE